MTTDRIACDANVLIGLGSNGIAPVSSGNVKLTCDPTPRGNVSIETLPVDLPGGVKLSIFLDPEDARHLAEALDRAADVAEAQIDRLNEKALGDGEAESAS